MVAWGVDDVPRPDTIRQDHAVLLWPQPGPTSRQMTSDERIRCPVHQACGRTMMLGEARTSQSVAMRDPSTNSPARRRKVSRTAFCGSGAVFALASSLGQDIEILAPEPPENPAGIRGRAAQSRKLRQNSVRCCRSCLLTDTAISFWPGRAMYDAIWRGLRMRQFIITFRRYNPATRPVLRHPHPPPISARSRVGVSPGFALHHARILEAGA